jgi:hypothetical protein
LNAAIPTQLSCRIRIATRDVGIPTIANSVITGILPIHRPSADWGCRVIGYFDRRRKTIIPLVGDLVLATRIRVPRQQQGQAAAEYFGKLRGIANACVSIFTHGNSPKLLFKGGVFELYCDS